ncbi:MAG: hypothetical protein IJ889_03195 [Eubacterium sp.]|nr:hypothetical protein [Eubacterium sp.]
MANERKELIKKGMKGEPGDIENLSFSDIAAMLYVPISDTEDRSYLDVLIQQWRSAAVSNTDLNNVFNQLFTFKDEKGKIRYLKAFSYLTPRDWTLTVEGK